MNHRFVVLSSLACAVIWLGLADLQSAVAHDDGPHTGHREGWWGDQVRGSGKIVRETREIGEFDEIDLRDSTDLELTIGSPRSLTVEADDNLMSHIVTSIGGKRLRVESHGSYTTRHSPKLIVTVPSLTALAIHGSGDATLVGLSGERLKLSIDGSGDIRARGDAGTLELRINGSGDADLSRLVARSATVAINGSGDARLDVREQLDAVVNGSGDIRYDGEPARVQKRVRGSGEISAR